MCSLERDFRNEVMKIRFPEPLRMAAINRTMTVEKNLLFLNLIFSHFRDIEELNKT